METPRAWRLPEAGKLACDAPQPWRQPGGYYAWHLFAFPQRDRPRLGPRPCLFSGV